MSGAEPVSRPKPAGAAQRAAPRRQRAPDYHFTAAGLVLNSQKPCIHFGEEPIFHSRRKRLLDCTWASARCRDAAVGETSRAENLSAVWCGYASWAQPR